MDNDILVPELSREGPTGNRIGTLDSMRGLAALTVVNGHVMLTLFMGNTILDRTPLYLLRAAHEAVIFFFLLSGFVLSAPHIAGVQFRYSEFVARRFCRIYLPYIAAVIFCIFLKITFYDPSATAGMNWLSEQWRDSLSPEMLINHLLLVGNFNTHALDPVIWSLVHEMRIALLFPLLLVTLRLCWFHVLVVAMALSLVAGVANAFNLNPSVGFCSSYIFTAHYFGFFLLGGLVAKHRRDLVAFYQRLSRRQQIALVTGALLMCAYARVFQMALERIGLSVPWDSSIIVVDWLTALPAAILMTAALANSGSGSWLERPMLLILGRISYSLYLINIPVLLIVASFMRGVGAATILGVGFIISVGAALIFNRIVEQPATRLGRTIGCRLKISDTVNNSA